MQAWFTADAPALTLQQLLDGASWWLILLFIFVVISLCLYLAAPFLHGVAAIMRVTGENRVRTAQLADEINRMHSRQSGLAWATDSDNYGQKAEVGNEAEPRVSKETER